MRSLAPRSRLKWVPAAGLLLSGLSIAAGPATCVETAGPRSPAAVTAADFDGDGRTDVASGGNVGLQVRLSRGRQLRLTGGKTVAAVAAVDLDRDGDRDLIALTGRGRLFIWRNDGAGHFSVQPPRPRSTRLAPEPRAVLEGGSAGHFPAQSTGDRTAARIVKIAGSVCVPDCAGPLAPASAVPSLTGLDSSSPRSPPLSWL